MDQESPPWSTRFLNMFGKNIQPGIAQQKSELDEAPTNNREPSNSMEFGTYVEADRLVHSREQRNPTVTSQRLNNRNAVSSQNNVLDADVSGRSITSTTGNGSSQNNVLDEASRRNFAVRSITNSNQRYIVPPPQRVNNHDNGNLSGINGRRWNSQSNGNAKSNLNEKQPIRNTVTNNQPVQSTSNSAPNKKQSVGNRNQRSENYGRNYGQNNDRKPNDNRQPQSTVGAQGNGNRNARRATMSQASQQAGTDSNDNSSQSGVTRRRLNSFNGKTNPNVNQKPQQFRNAGTNDQPVGSSSTRLPNQGHTNVNRNQRSENNGNFHRRKENLQT